MILSSFCYFFQLAKLKKELDIQCFYQNIA